MSLLFHCLRSKACLQCSDTVPNSTLFFLSHCMTCFSHCMASLLDACGSCCTLLWSVLHFWALNVFRWTLRFHAGQFRPEGRDILISRAFVFSLVFCVINLCFFPPSSVAVL